MSRAVRPLPERFWERVDIGDPDECWPWSSYRFWNGYGSVADLLGSPENVAHRLAYRLATGPIPEGLWVLHNCDNPPCCNPTHLRVGTASDNNRDRYARDRAPIGADHHKSKLTEADVLAIRASDKPHTELAKEYGVSPGGIWSLRTRRTWKHI